MFYIKVLNTILKNDKNENIIFDNLQEKLSYFNIHTNEQVIINNYLPCNIDIRNGINITATINARQSKEHQNSLLNYNMYELLNCNYAFIYDSNGEKEYEKFRFYYIDKIYHDTMRNQFICTLSLDVIQTYYNYLVFEDCLIERCFLNRFYSKNNNDILTFNYKKDSYFLVDNYENNNDIAKEKHELVINQVPFEKERYNENIYILNNVKAWLYCFIKYSNESVGIAETDNDRVNKAYLKLGGANFGTGLNLPPIAYETNTDSGLICLCAPIYKTNNKLYFERNTKHPEYLDFEFSVEEIYNIIRRHNLSENVLSFKVSKLSPFYLIDNSLQISNNYNFNFISNNTIAGYLTSIDYGCPGSAYFITDDFGRYVCLSIPFSKPLFDIDIKYPIYNNGLIVDLDSDIPLNSNIDIHKDYIKDNYYSIKADTHCNDIEIITYKDKNKFKNICFNSTYINLKYYEILTPDILTYIIDFILDNDSVYKNEEKTYSFITGNIDSCLLYNVKLYDSFISNNKNYFNNLNLNLGKIAFNQLTSTADNMIKNYANINPLVKGFFDLTTTKLESDYQIENYKKGVGNIKNTNANIYMDILYNDLNFYIMYYTTNKNKEKQIYTNEKRFAYSYNVFDNIKNVQNRKYYNYIKAQVDNVHIEYSNNIYYLANELIQELKNIFSKGIALFRYSDFYGGDVQFDYTINNYERELDNE